MMDNQQCPVCRVEGHWERAWSMLNEMRFDAVDAARSDSEQVAVLSIYEYAFRTLAECEDSERGWDAVTASLWYTCPAELRQDVLNVLADAREETIRTGGGGDQ